MADPDAAQDRRPRRSRCGQTDARGPLAPAHGARSGLCVALALCALSAAADQPPAPWEIQGYSQGPRWGASAATPDVSRGADSQRAWSDPDAASGYRRPWSGRDWTTDAPPDATLDAVPADQARQPPAAPWDGPPDADAQYPAPIPGDGAAADQGGRFGLAAPGPGSRAAPMPYGGGSQPSATYPGYRFRGDPPTGGTPWAGEPDGGGYRFRPLTAGELERRGRGPEGRPTQPRAQARQPARDGPWTGPGPGYGYGPGPWQPR